MSVTKRLQISGDVQGVGFRMYMVRKARELGVTGWVRNRFDGSVEAVVQGSAEAVDAILTWARQGPPSARVREVRVSEAAGQFSGFETRQTE
jgi:acylphosphatase